jgi:hypothetical protein
VGYVTVVEKWWVLVFLVGGGEVVSNSKLLMVIA